MSDLKISSLIALSLISPIATPANPTASLEAIQSISSSQRASLRKMHSALSLAPKLEPMGMYVGELQERWQFPSDHLPIGMSVDGIEMASWNVLESDSMDWVTEKNSQGLSRSLIAQEHVVINDSGLTLRDRHVVDLLLQMMDHPNHPRSIFSLQECSRPFLTELQARLPERFSLIEEGGNAVLIDCSVFTNTQGKIARGVFGKDPRTFLDITVERFEDGKKVRIVNAHLPGDPNGPGRAQFAQYLAETNDPNVLTIAMGDMNFNEFEMGDAMQQAFSDPTYSIYSPYCTNIGPYNFVSKCIDHFMIQNPEYLEVKIREPEEVLQGLIETAQLLQNF